ncbi:MAG TPA: hypothetical protein VFA04_25940 [Bryobacteraceae bacterium]|nr:hypothetical protein [Bryobacteraceae bacterium]
MRNDTVFELGRAVVLLQPGSARRRFRVKSAVLTVLPRGRLRLRLEGPQGWVAIEISRTRFWQLTEALHESSIRARDSAPLPRPRRQQP